MTTLAIMNRIIEVHERLAPARRLIPNEAVGMGVIGYAHTLMHGCEACFICGHRSQLVHDHCHDTGQIRAHLCRSCNTLEGFGTNHEFWNAYRKYAPGLGLYVSYQNPFWKKIEWPQVARSTYEPLMPDNFGGDELEQTGTEQRQAWIPVMRLQWACSHERGAQYLEWASVQEAE